MTKNNFNAYIQNNDFKGLFNEMGYDHANGIDVHLDFDEVRYNFTAVAQKSGFVVFTSQVSEIPSNAFCKQLDSKLRKRANDYILIFIQKETFHHLWCVPVKTVEKRNLVSIEYTSLSQTEFLFSKIDALSFGLEEEVTITDVTSRIQDCFAVNSEKVTKDFYAGFKKQHTNFEKFIKGIPESNNEDRQWYASVMLNRLMFCYFIQKKGFLDFDPDYLQNKLKWSKEQQGKDKFFKSFYKNFLTHLFAGGLNDPAHDKNAEFKKIFGRIPYLNGGMFDQHEIEKQYADLDIEDKAFEDLFNFFDTYRWHLDTRIESSGKDINPDVLGYIFEQYINDRAKMGAYYTKEDITNYIGKNCIIPYLLEQVKEKCPADFGNSESNGYVWNHLKQSGLRYIYPAVQKGYSVDWKNKIPADIAKGLKENCPFATDVVTEQDVSTSPLETSLRSDMTQCHSDQAKRVEESLSLLKAREHWNEPTPSEFSLPTEIWRETIERLERCDAIANKIVAGEITQINDFITYNLDIISFAQDLIENATSIDFVKTFYHALQNVTILDPTCGSGAFLFAALNILEPLYDLCLDAMERLGDTTENEEIKKHFRSNRAYFIYKSIILRNLYGVDIMKEAVEIAKLRLFLKMVAVVEVNAREENLGLDPLPDVDFNIRCGNTLVGCVTKKEAEESSHIDDMFAKEEYAGAIKDAMKKVAETAEKFRKTQLIENGELTVDNCNTGREDTPVLEIKKAKQELTNDLADLNEKLNRQQYAASTGIILSEKPTEKQMQEYNEWLKKTQPFHWIAEFFNIIENGKLTVDNEEMPRGFESANAASLKKGGFDVIIGNPPYVEYNEKKFDYKIEGYKTKECGNLHAYIAERAFMLSAKNAKIGLIVPLPSMNTARMITLQHLIKPTNNHDAWISAYDERPSGLFNGVDQRLIIEIIAKEKSGNLFTTGITRWLSKNRDLLFKKIIYSQQSKENLKRTISILKQQRDLENNIFEKFYINQSISVKATNSMTKNPIYYRTAGGRYWKVFLNIPFGTTSLSEKCTYFTDFTSVLLIAILSSDVFWWYYSSHFDMFNLKDYMIFGFKFSDVSKETSVQLERLGKEYLKSLNDNAENKSIHSKTKGDVIQKQYYIRKSKPIIDKIDTVLAAHYGFTQEELDFIINYDIKYRMGDNLNDAE